MNRVLSVKFIFQRYATHRIFKQNQIACFSTNFYYNLNKLIYFKDFLKEFKRANSNFILKSEFPTLKISNEPFSKVFLNLIQKYANEDPNRFAIINATNEKDSVTFGNLYSYSQSICGFLNYINFSHGDCSCVVLPNCWEYVAIFGGIISTGGFMSGVCPNFTPFELRRQFEDSKSKVVFCMDDKLTDVLDALENLQNITYLIVVCHNKKNILLPEKKGHLSILSFDDLLSNKFNNYKMNLNVNPEKDLLILPYSSGTTGLPKGVMISHKNFMAMMSMFSWQFKNKILSFIDSNYDFRKETQIHALPFYHIYGIGIIVNHLMEGSTICLMKVFDPNLLCKVIEKYKCRILMLVPPIMIFLAKSSIAQKYDLSSLLLTVSGAAPAGKELCEELQNRLPNIKAVTQGYGMTELSLCSHLPVLDGINRYDKAGKLMPNMELKILNIKTKKELSFGMIGEIYLRGPNVMMGYYNRPDATKETLDNEGWLKTGDIAYVDEEGFLKVVDRLKELIKVNAYQVAPAELEDILLSHPEIVDCAVIGVKCNKNGELPKAFVVRANDQLTEDEVKDYIKDRVVYYKHLRGGVEFIDSIPKSASGKVLRRTLRDRENKSKNI